MGKQSPTWPSILGLLLAIVAVLTGSYVYAMARHADHPHADAISRAELGQLEKRIDIMHRSLSEDLRRIHEKLK